MAPATSKPIDTYAHDGGEQSWCMSFFDTIGVLCNQQRLQHHSTNLQLEDDHQASSAAAGTSLEVEGTSPSEQPHHSSILTRSSSLSSRSTRSMTATKALGLGFMGSTSPPSNEHDHRASSAAANTSLEVEGASSRREDNHPNGGGGGDELDDDFVVPSHFYDDMAGHYRNTTAAASQFFSKKRNVVLAIAAVAFTFSIGLALPLSTTRGNKMMETYPKSYRYG